MQKRQLAKSHPTKNDDNYDSIDDKSDRTDDKSDR